MRVEWPNTVTSHAKVSEVSDAAEAGPLADSGESNKCLKESSGARWHCEHAVPGSYFTVDSMPCGNCDSSMLAAGSTRAACRTETVTAAWGTESVTATTAPASSAMHAEAQTPAAADEQAQALEDLAMLEADGLAVTWPCGSRR